MNNYLNPINFFNDDDIFSVDIDVFDINYRNLLHIIDERRERFPDNIKDLSTNIVATRLRNALTQGLKYSNVIRIMSKHIILQKQEVFPG